MDRAEYLDLFARLDDQTHGEWPGEFPRGFSWYAAERKFLTLAEDVEQALGEKCTIEHGASIQDASFHGLLSVPKSCKIVEDYAVGLRVSNFGNLATLYDADEVVKSVCLDRIKQVLKRHECLYIPSWVLNESYPPHIDLIHGIKNWGVRYFDYL